MGDEARGPKVLSPLASSDVGGGGVRTGKRARHPGWGFGYNGPDPRVRFDPQVQRCVGVWGRPIHCYS